MPTRKLLQPLGVVPPSQVVTPSERGPRRLKVDLKELLNKYKQENPETDDKIQIWKVLNWIEEHMVSTMNGCFDKCERLCRMRKEEDVCPSSVFLGPRSSSRRTFEDILLNLHLGLLDMATHVKHYRLAKLAANMIKKADVSGTRFRSAQARRRRHLVWQKKRRLKLVREEQLRLTSKFVKAGTLPAPSHDSAHVDAKETGTWPLTKEAYQAEVHRWLFEDNDHSEKTNTFVWNELLKCMNHPEEKYPDLCIEDMETFMNVVEKVHEMKVTAAIKSAFAVATTASTAASTAAAIATAVAASTDAVAASTDAVAASTDAVHDAYNAAYTPESLTDVQIEERKLRIPLRTMCRCAGLSKAPSNKENVKALLEFLSDERAPNQRARRAIKILFYFTSNFVSRFFSHIRVCTCT